MHSGSEWLPPAIWGIVLARRAYVSVSAVAPPPNQLRLRCDGETEDPDMLRGAFAHFSAPHAEDHDHGNAWSSTVAIVFVAIAVLSLAVDLAVSLSARAH